jgi:hypothetical protein
MAIIKKAQNGIVTKKKTTVTKKTYPIIPENPDASRMLNDYERDRKSGKIPLDPNIQRGIKNGTLNPDGTTKKGMKMGGSLKKVPSNKPGLKKLPTPVRNKMGFQKNGGKVKK